MDPRPGPRHAAEGQGRRCALEKLGQVSLNLLDGL